MVMLEGAVVEKKEGKTEAGRAAYLIIRIFTSSCLTRIRSASHAWYAFTSCIAPRAWSSIECAVISSCMVHVHLLHCPVGLGQELNVQ